MSQSDSQSKTFDGTLYTVYMLPPKTARKILVRVFQVLGPSLGEAFTRDDEKLSAAIGPIVREFTDRISDEDLDWIMDALTGVTTISPGGEKTIQLRSVFDAQFKGKIGTMFKWFAFALEVQFSDFFGGSAGGLGQLLAGIKETLGSVSPSISTGASGD